MSTHSSPFPSCFRPPSADNLRVEAAPPLPPPPPPPPGNDNANLTTCLYHTHLGLFSLTWSKTLFGRSLHLSLHSHHGGSNFLDYNSSPLSPSSSTFSFHLHIKPLVFWKKHGSKKLDDADKTSTSSSIRIFWDLTRAKFGSGPEPESGFYIAVVVNGDMALLVGDAAKSAYNKTKARKPVERGQVLFLRREHLFGHRVYETSARFGGKNRAISIDCNVHGEGRLCINVDKRRVLSVKRLKWKFRGNERVEVDGVNFQVSWDVYNWLFEDASDSHAVFMFRFEKPPFHHSNEEDRSEGCGGGGGGVKSVSDLLLWSQPSCSFGMNEIELRKMRKSKLKSARSSSSSSSISSSASSGGSSSVMEWASAEENELNGPFVGFSLLVYAWKR